MVVGRYEGTEEEGKDEEMGKERVRHDVLCLRSFLDSSRVVIIDSGSFPFTAYAAVTLHNLAVCLAA